MSAKITAARRAAFLKALAETGNQTLSAEWAKVSRSWVVLHRKRDVAFDAAVRAACLDFAREERSGTEPPSGWGFLDGEELVVRGTGGAGGGKRVQIARARIRQWSPRVEDRFLATLAATCNVKAGCAEVGLTATSAYEHRKRWRSFARRWDEAVEIGYRRLLLGLVEYAGNPFSSQELPEPGPTPPMTVDEMLHNLYMHQHKVDGLGDPPGLPPRPCSFEQARAAVSRAIDAIEGGARFDEAEKARHREEYARRSRRAEG